MRLVFPCSVTLVLLVWFLLWVAAGHAVPTAQAQTAADTTTADRYLFLPLVQTEPVHKSKSGIHLGNRGSSDWPTGMFSLITGKGNWPAAVVVLSDQLYTLQRATTGKCRITAASVKLTGAGEPYNIYKYLTEAIKAGTQVVIRLTPSPGNFADYAAPGGTHTLLATETPAGGDYCGNANKHFQYRDIRDLAEEMDAIYTVNSGNGWDPASFYFEPANEPNVEWYHQKGQVNPNADNKQAWIDMDEYFAALYDRAKQLEPTLQILAPPMSQGFHGEHYALGTCDDTTLTVVGGNGRTGLDFMKKTYGYDIGINSYTSPKADGFAWHNYWKAGQEDWEYTPGVVPTLDAICPGNTDYKPGSDHLYQYLSEGMQRSMVGKPIFITEADLQSPCQNGLNPIPDKDEFPYSTRDSLLQFVNQEYGAKYVIVWLLVNEYADEATTCANDHPNFEINWHEAYFENGVERQWFTLWWQAAQ